MKITVEMTLAEFKEVTGLDKFEVAQESFNKAITNSLTNSLTSPNIPDYFNTQLLDNMAKIFSGEQK